MGTIPRRLDRYQLAYLKNQNPEIREALDWFWCNMDPAWRCIWRVQSSCHMDRDICQVQIAYSLRGSHRVQYREYLRIGSQAPTFLTIKSSLLSQDMLVS